MPGSRWTHVRFPSDRSRRRRVRSFFLTSAVLLVALNLRPIVAGVGPLLDEVRGDLGASAAWAGLLTTIPVLCFAFAGLAAPALVQRIGLRSTIAGALILLTVGLALRVTGGPLYMLLMTAVAAIGVAIGGVLLPVAVKTSFPSRIGFVTGLYTAALQSGAAVAFVVSTPLSILLGGWRAALGSWALLAAVGLAVWLAAFRKRGPSSGPALREDVAPTSVLRSRLAWTVTAFFGLQAFVAFAVLGWLAQVLIDAGTGRAHAGVLMGVLTIVALPVSLLVPPIAGRKGGQTGWIIGLGACGLLGTAGFRIAPTTAPLLWVVLLGLGMSVFSLALTVIALRARTGHDTARLSGMTQGFGYLLAATGPLLFGLLRDATGDWDMSLTVLMGVVVAQTVAGAYAGRPRYI